MKTVNNWLVFLLILTLALSSCASPTATVPAPEQLGGSATEASTQLKSITVGRGANDPKSIDPQTGQDNRDNELSAQMFPGLLLHDVQTNELLPGLAKSWDISPDGLVYTFHLIQEVPWVRYNAETGAVEKVKDISGNVRYVTAKDVAYGFTRALNPETTSLYAYILAPYIVGGVEYNSGRGTAYALGVKAIDDYTFEVTAPEALGYTLGIYSLTTAKPTPEWVINANGDAWTEPANINTFGPYALKDWSHETSMTLVKNPFWPGSKGVGQAKIDEITFQFIDAAASLSEFEAGNIDVSPVPSDQIVRVQEDPKLGPQLKVVPGTCTQAWGFNTTKVPFDNTHIRRAFNFAVDRSTLVADVLAGGQIPAAFFTPPSVAMAPSAQKEYWTVGGTIFDPQKAKAELTLGLQDLKLSSVDQLPPITVEYGTSTELTSIAQALQSMWQETLGIQVTLQEIDVKVYWGRQIEDAAQIHRAGWCPDYNDANNYLLDVFRSDSVSNYGKWKNTEYDELIDRARVETTESVRLDLYAKAEKILNFDDAATMTLYYPVVASITKPNIIRTYSLIGPDSYWDWDISQ